MSVFFKVATVSPPLGFLPLRTTPFGRNFARKFKLGKVFHDDFPVFGFEAFFETVGVGAQKGALAEFELVFVAETRHFKAKFGAAPAEGVGLHVFDLPRVEAHKRVFLRERRRTRKHRK